MDEAIDHIERYGSEHTETIVTNNYQRSESFIDRVNSSAVMVNASTRFNDGGEIGLGRRDRHQHEQDSRFWTDGVGRTDDDQVYCVGGWADSGMTTPLRKPYPLSSVSSFGFQLRIWK